ncbi:PREDICTED: polymerase I and transcript release factor isoform X2 [Colobus angolensis palliatus]|uniref:polymerase I and transcript release factor isoform X2 n=1 Tax=Colobus angolensis palliatus TaxID=336983 RepID=UPI0005F4FA65|nr:PREDICTED: polymerase I and transcript release factor isoform X2 [Colobus angolensis palliatus]
MSDQTTKFGRGAGELTDPPPSSSGRCPGAHGRGSSFLCSRLSPACSPPFRSCFSPSLPLQLQLHPAGPARLRVAMEDPTLYIVERPLPGYPDAEAPELSSAGAQAAEEPSGAVSEELIKSDQVNGVLVLSLLDKIIGAVDQIQLTQAQLEERQAEMEGAVQSIQGELSKLGKVSVNVKTVRGSLERQAGQIKKLEVNEAELLRRRNFKVMIYQDEVKLPAKVSISKSLKESEALPEKEGEELGEGDRPEDDAAALELSSDEAVEVEEVIEESRAERIKRSGLRRVDDFKKAFSKEKMEKTKVRTRENLEKTRLKTKENLEKTRHTLEKRMNKLGTRLVPAERREKLKTSRDKLRKSFTPDHVVYARSKTAVYKVPPFTFHVKKIREGQVEVLKATEMVEVGADDDEGGAEHGEAGDLRRGSSPDAHALLEITEESDAVLVDKSDSD